MTAFVDSEAGSVTASNNELYIEDTIATNATGSTTRINLDKGHSYPVGQFNFELTNRYVTGLAENNTLTVKNSELNSASAVKVVLNNETMVSDLTLKNNSVTVTGEKSKLRHVEAVFLAKGGNFANEGDSVTFNLSDNKVFVTDKASVEVGVYGVNASLNTTTDAVFATYKNNFVEINNSSVEGDVYGAAAGSEKNYSLENNIVNLVNATVKGTVYGATAGMRTLVAINEKNYIKAQGINTVGHLDGFEKLTLNIDQDNYSTIDEGVVGDKAVITLTGNDSLSFANRSIELNTVQGFQVPAEGYFNLIHIKGNGTLTIPDKTTITYTDTFKLTKWSIVGDQLEYSNGETFALSFEKTTSEETGGDAEGGEENTPPIITPTEQKPTDNAKTLAENYLGSAALIGLGTEYIADEGLAMIVDSAKLPGKNVFGAIYGGTGKYHTGSRLDLDSATLITGISAMTEKQTMAISAFVEAGWGDSEGHVNQAHAKADHNVYSMGTAMRFFTDSPLYFDASARLGVARFDYTGNFSTESVKFDHSGIYAALHGAVGYAYPITEDTTLDSYLRYSFTYLEGGSEKLHNRSEDSFKMDSIRASAFRVGTRVKGYIGEDQWLNYRVGAAYEKVVDGDANTKISGMSIDAPSLNGDTGIFEIGLAKRPTIQSPWGVDVTVKGYAGDRDGVYGSATVNYVF